MVNINKWMTPIDRRGTKRGWIDIRLCISYDLIIINIHFKERGAFDC